MALGYSPGGSQFHATSHNFVSFYNAHKPDVDNMEIPRYGRETLVGLFDVMGQRKPTHSIEFERFEKDRIYPKIKATTGGAGAGAAATFTLASDASRSISQAEPYDTGGTDEGTGVPVHELEEILIKPSSGTVSAGNYIHALVTGVNASAGTFTAQPLDPSESVPSIGTAEEIIRIGRVQGEGGDLPGSYSFTSTRFKDQLQILSGRHRNTGTEKLQKLWYEDSQDPRNPYKFMIKGEDDAYLEFLKSQDLTLLMGEEINNTSLFNSYKTTPLAKTKGLIPNILDRGNTVNYAGGIGMTIDDFYELNITLDKQKGSMENTAFLGIELDQQLDQELGDKFVNGGISYGSFSGDEEKKVALNFNTFRVGSYTYHKRKFDIFSDLQSLGADGYGFPKEGFILPNGTITQDQGPEKGETVPVVRKRYLANPDTGESREMEVTYFNGFELDPDGADVEEVRYRSHCGLELLAANQTAYIKQA